MLPRRSSAVTMLSRTNLHLAFEIRTRGVLVLPVARAGRPDPPAFPRAVRIAHGVLPEPHDAQEEAVIGLSETVGMFDPGIPERGRAPLRVNRPRAPMLHMPGLL